MDRQIGQSNKGFAPTEQSRERERERERERRRVVWYDLLYAISSVALELPLLKNARKI